MGEETERSTAMVRLFALQRRTYAGLPALLGLGLDVPDDAFERYLANARGLLAGVTAFEERWPGTFEVQGYAEPLVQQLSRYADYSEATGNRERATYLRAEADRLTARHLDAVATASIVRTRAMEHAAAGRFHEALAGLSAAHQAFETSGDHVQAAQTLVQQANVLEWLCDYDRSLTILDTAASLVATDLGDGPPSMTRVALALGKEVLSIVRGKQDTGGLEALALRRVHFEIVQGRARINRALGNNEEARRLFEDARSFVQLLVRPGVDFHLAAIAIAQGELEEADRLLSTIEPAFEKGLLRPRRAAVRQLQADLLLGQDRPAQALARAEDGLADQGQHPDLDLAWKLQWRRARALSALGRTQESLDAYEAAVDAADKLRLAPLGYVLDTTFIQDKLPMFEQAIDEAVAQHDADRAVHFMELVKARALSAVLSNPRLAGDTGDGLEARFDAVSVELDAISFKLNSGAAGAADLGRRDELLRTRTELLEEIRVHDPRWRVMTEAARVSVPDVQTDAGRRVLVLHRRRRRRIISVAIGPGRTVMGEMECTEETEAALLDYAANLRKSSPDWFLADLSGELGVTLTDLVPDAVATAALEAETLVVVPHGILHLLPWATLQLGELRLFQHTAVGVLPNLSALALLDGDLGRPTSIALLGDPDYADLQTYQDLPQAGAEIEDIARLYGNGLVVPPITRKAADDTALVALVQEPDVAGSVLHIVSHGDLDADEPLSSGLILTRSKLDAAEVMQLHCGYPEVVLSACSTGWRPQASGGLELAGDDALGLTASFLEAGARSMLASISQAKDDVTHRFMVEWHRHRRAGATPLHATRQVQLELFAADPAAIWSWAGITAYGCR